MRETTVCVGTESLQLYLAEINAISRLSHAEERELAQRVQLGDEQAKQRFILANLRLVVAVARGYSTTELELLDHIQNGYFGLLKAVERYDPARRVHFGTYAMFWIRQAIGRAAEMSARLIHLPVYVQDELRSLSRMSDVWLAAHGTEPPVEFLAEALGVEVEHIQVLQAVREDAASLDRTYELEEDGLSFGEDLADPLATMAYTLVERVEEDEEVEALLRRAWAHLTDRERTVIMLYYGLGREAVSSYASIGRVIGISRTRVRIIWLGALCKLRQACASLALQEVQDGI